MYTGQIIKLIRTVDGISQGELARKLHVTRTYLSQVENGKKQPSINLLKQFSEKFSVPLPLLFLGEREDEIHEDIFKELQEILARLLAARASQLKKESKLELWE